MSKEIKQKFYVISRTRNSVDPKYLNDLASGVNIPGYDIKSFNNIEDARKYYYNGFFDDSDVRIYTLIKDKWYLYQENYTLVKVAKPKESVITTSKKIVCHERNCGDPYNEGWTCYECLKR